MESLVDPRLQPGANNPPDAIEELAAALQASNEPLIKRQGDLLGMDARLPAECTDADTAKKLSDAVKACTAFSKHADAARKSAKEPHLAAGRAVDGFYQNLADPVEKLKMKIGGMLTDYQKAEADRERRRLQAIEEEQRRVAAEAAKVAREAERVARVAREAEEARAAEARRAAEALAGKARAEALAAEQKRAAEAKAKQEADEEAAKKLRDEARGARQDANIAKEDAGVKAADLTRSRSDYGSVASLRTTWRHDVIDAKAVPRLYLEVSDAAIKVAIKAATKGGKCSLVIPGVKIYPVEETVVR